MSDKQEAFKDNQQEKNKPQDENDDNSVKTCAGGLTDDQARELQEELDRAKEENNFSSKSMCSIT